VGKLEVKRPNERWEDNIKIDLQKVECGMGRMEWIDLAMAGTGGGDL
jgi:hypothetical protein